MMLKTERLTLHVASKEEMQELIAKTEDEGVRQAYTEMLTMSEKYPESRPWYAAWFMEKADGERVGELCFKGISLNGTAEIGYGVLPAFQGRGYATEAVRAVTAWALSRPGVDQITAETEDSNAASQRVLKKVGFVPTGAYGEEGPLFVLSRKAEEHREK